MNPQIDEFLSIGLKRFKPSTVVMISFENEIKTRLQEVLAVRTAADEWGSSFKPSGQPEFKRSQTWKEYPHLSAYIPGELGDAKVKITMSIAVNWYESDADYPYYEIYIQGDTDEESNNALLRSLNKFPQGRQVRYFHTWIDTLRLDPDEDDFDLKRDFGILLDEVVGFFDEGMGESDKVTGVGE